MNKIEIIDPLNRIMEPALSVGARYSRHARMVCGCRRTRRVERPRKDSGEGLVPARLAEPSAA